MEELTTRKRIYEEIVLNPGLHFRELQRRLQMPTGMLTYHLNILEKHGLISSRRDGKYVRYFANTSMTVEERSIMGALRNYVARRIVIYLLEEGEKKHRDISDELKISPSTLSYHLNKLIRKGILEKRERGRETYYSVRKRDLVAFTIIKYRKSFLDALVDNFASLWIKNDKK